MTSYFIVYAFLFIALGAMLYVVGTPWLTPKPRNAALEKSQEGVIEENML